MMGAEPRVGGVATDRAWRSARLATLGALGVALLWLSLSGRLGYYLHESQTWLVALAGAALLGVLAVASRQVSPHPEREGQAAGRPEGECAPPLDRSARARFLALTALALPVALVLAPARPLGAAAALTLGVNEPAPLGGEPGRLQLAFGTEHWTLVDWYRAWGHDPELQTLAGRRVVVEGFVLPGPGEEAGPGESFRVARIVITHCTADSQALALPVRTTDGGWSADQWVRVEGTLAATRVGRGVRPLVVADRIERIEPPARPYLSP